jgi:hypothetical protein
MTPEIRSYFVSLCARADNNEAVVVPFVRVRDRDWEPKSTLCHPNADHWAGLKQGRRAVRGWIVDGSDGMGGHLFKAHSVVEEDGKLFDITPSDRFPDDPPKPEPARLFLRHEGEKRAFDDMLPEYNCVPFNSVATK